MSGDQTILIVDDDAFIRRPLEFILREEGFNPVTAVDGDDCFRKLADQPADLIILDVMMPGRDGFEVCRTLKQDPRLAGIPVSAIGLKVALAGARVSVPNWKKSVA